MRFQTTQRCCLGAGKVMNEQNYIPLNILVVIPCFLRSSVALHAEVDALEDLGNFLRTVSLEVDPTYREKDGIVGQLST